MPVWHGPISKGHGKCTQLGVIDDAGNDVKACKKECLKVGCNTFSFDESSLRCVFHACLPSVLAFPERDLRNTNTTTYLYSGNLNYNVTCINIL